MDGETSERTEVIGPEQAEALAGVLDIETPCPTAGDALPPLWHWVYLLERPRNRDLGPDGHPTAGIPAPPGPGRQRMFAGGRVTTRSPLLVGEPATRTTTVVASVEKQGRSGTLTFVTVRSELRQRGDVAIVDEQDIVYRAPGSVLPQPDGAARPAPRDADADDAGDHAGRLTMDVDEVLLFRFSALTYNAHRIHYDSGYAARAGYPGLVVHGPLQALMIGELMRRSGVPLLGRQFEYRLVAPTFGVQRLTACLQGEPDVRADVRDAAGRLTATGAVTAP